ncbi:MAG: epoxyqueuosine reductase QueH [Mogibacterium sp.]|nr:epoxyqueuosine reductase QueH [Mogibacterium sp.]
MKENSKPLLYTGPAVPENADADAVFRNLQLEDQRPRVLLHACCGPCATSCVERLADDYSVTVFYYNPNIMDAEEYFLRRDNLIRFLDAFNSDRKKHIAYLEGAYEPDLFIRRAEALRDEPEGGRRCSICFEMRLAETARMAARLEMDYFTTTMTVSPHKNYEAITACGLSLAEGIRPDYLAIDFKKKNGFGRSVELSKQYGLYRQRFCGCEYSRYHDQNSREKNR